MPDPAEYYDTEEFQQGIEDVAAYVRSVEVATVANIARQFPQHERMLFSLLDQLKAGGQVYWDEWRPLPTMVYAGDKRIPHKQYNWRTARDREKERNGVTLEAV